MSKDRYIKSKDKNISESVRDILLYAENHNKISFKDIHGGCGSLNSVVNYIEYFAKNENNTEVIKDCALIKNYSKKGN